MSSMSRKGQKAVSEVSGASLVGSETFDDRIYIMIKIVKVSHHYRNIFVDGVFTAMMFKNVYGNWILQYGGQNHIFDSVAEARKFLPKIIKSTKKAEPNFFGVALIQEGDIRDTIYEFWLSESDAEDAQDSSSESDL